MKKSSIVLLAGLLACSVAGAATASALIISGAHAPQQSGTTDSVLYLEWGTTEDLASVSNLTPDAPAYRTVSVAAPEKSATAPDGKFTATLAVNDAVSAAEGNTLSADGISVAIYDAAYQQSGEPGAGANRIGTADLTMSNTSVTDVVTAAKVYYLKISISQAAYDSYVDVATSHLELAAKITFSYGVNA